MKLEQQTIYRGILTIQQGELTGEEQATIAVNIQRGHRLKVINVEDSGEIKITLELEGARKESIWND